MKHTRTVYIYLFLSLTIPTLFSSCRKESDTLIQPSEEQVLQANSKAVELLSKVTANDGKNDNIIDSSSLISIVLPVSVEVEGDIYIINNQDDIESIEDLIFETEDGEVNIIFPIDVILYDYSAQRINTQQEFDALLVNLESTATINEILECIGIRYPVEISVFDRDTEITEVLSLENNEQLFAFLQNLNENVISTLSAPVTIILPDGSNAQANTVSELVEIIEDVEDDCEDEDDTVDGDDITIDIFIETLVNGEWEIQKFKDDEDNQTQEFRDYQLNFDTNGSIDALNTDSNETFSGSWSVETNSDNELNVTIEFTNSALLERLNKDNWIVKKIQDNRIMFEDEDPANISKDELFLKKI